MYAKRYPGWTEEVIENTKQSTLAALPVIWEIQNQQRGAGTSRQTAIALAYEELDRANATRRR